MKKCMFFALGAALLIASGLQAQTQARGTQAGQQQRGRRVEQKSPEEMAQARTDRMKVVLQLSDDQARKFHDVELKYAKMMQDARTDMGKFREAAGTQMKDRQSAIEAVLTAPQKAALNALHPHVQGKDQGTGTEGRHAMRSGGPRRGAMMGRMHKRGAMATPEMAAKAESERIQSLLQLSADQTKKIYDIVLKYANLAKTNRESAMKAMQANAAKFAGRKDDVKAILTPAQQTAFAQVTKMERERVQMMRTQMRGRNGGRMGGFRPRGGDGAPAACPPMSGQVTK